MKERCGGGVGCNRRTTAPAERRTATWRAGREGGRGTRLHVSSPGSDRGESAGPAAGSLRVVGRTKG